MLCYIYTTPWALLRVSDNDRLKEMGVAMERKGMNRREFLLVAGGAAIAVPLAAFLGGCGSSSSGSAASNGDFVVPSVLTTHSHTITVKAADLTAGTQATPYTTSS